jgi:hypothetical protein
LLRIFQSTPLINVLPDFIDQAVGVVLLLGRGNPFLVLKKQLALFPCVF